MRHSEQTVADRAMDRPRTRGGTTNRAQPHVARELVERRGEATDQKSGEKIGPALEL